MKTIKNDKRIARAEKEICAAYNEATRNLNFRCDAPLLPSEAVAIMTKALDVKKPTDCGYNEFSPPLLAKLPANAELNIAREGSVCVYVKGDIETPDGFKNDERHFYADKNETRFWWD